MVGNSADSNKRIAKNTVFLYIRLGLVMIVALYTTRVVLQVLGVSDYGVYNVVCGFVAILGVFNSSLTAGTNRFYNYAIGSNKQNGVRKVYTASLLFQLFVVLLLLIIAESIGLWYINYHMTIPPDRLFAANIIYQLSLGSLLLLIFQIPYASAIIAYEKMDYYAVVGIIDVLLKLFLVILLNYIDYDKLILYGLFMAAIAVVDFLLYFVYCKCKFSEIKVFRPLDKDLLKQLMSFSGWSLLDPFTRTVQSQGSNLVLNFFFGPIVNAANAIAVQVSNAVNSFTQNISVAFRPQIIQSYSAEDYIRAKKLLLSMTKINFVLQTLLTIPVVFELSFLLTLWLGDSFPNYTIPFACFVMIDHMIGCFHEPISIIMSAKGDIKLIKSVSAVIMCSAIPLSIVLFNLNMSPIWIYILILVLSIVNLGACIKIMTKAFSYIGINEYLFKVILPCIMFMVILLVFPTIAVLFIPDSFLRLILITIVTLLLTLPSAYYIVLNHDEKLLSKEMCKSLINRIRK